LARAGLAARTVKHVHVVIHRALGQAKLWGLVRDNCAQMAKPPSAPDLELPILQPERARDLLERLRGQPLYLLASLALATGLRRSEALAGCRSRRRPSDGRTGVRANGHPRHPNYRPQDAPRAADDLSARAHRGRATRSLARATGTAPCPRHGQSACRRFRARRHRRQAAEP
jgi:integrase